MAQIRYQNHGRALNSFDENHKYLGLIEAGRHSGFDVMTQTGPLALTLSHTLTGTEKTLINNIAKSQAQGLCISRQGVFVYEDDVINPGPVDTNVGNASPRKDLVIMEHEWNPITGGQAAIYSIIKGPLNSLATPALTNALTQIAVGTINMPAGEANINNSIYTKSKPVALAGKLPALLDYENVFQKTLTTTKADVTLTTNKLSITDGNSFIVTTDDSGLSYISDKPTGTKIDLIFKAGTDATIILSNNPVVVAGYTSLTIPNTVFPTLQAKEDQSCTFIKLPTTWLLISTSAWDEEIVNTYAKASTNQGNITAIKSAWTNLPQALTAIRTNDQHDGQGNSDTSFGLDGTSFIRYKIIGKTCHVQVYFTGYVLKSASVIEARSIIVGSLPASLATLKPMVSSMQYWVNLTVEAGAGGSGSSSPQDYMNGTGEVYMDPANADKWVFRYRLQSGAFATFNRKYSGLNKDVEEINNQSLPTYNIQGTFSYELA